MLHPRLPVGIAIFTIANIQHDHKKSEDQLCAIIGERLKQEPPLTWHDIVTALRAESVGEYMLASEIERKYYHPPTSLSQDPLGMYIATCM